MDWLKEILEKTEITDGKIDIDTVMSTIQKEFPKHAVPKDIFNDKSEELRVANNTIEGLKKENGDNEKLQRQVSDYEAEILNLKSEQIKTAKEHALKSVLDKAGVLDTDYMIYRHGGVEKFNFDKDNNPIEIEDILNPIRESAPHLFKAKAGTNYKPNGGGNPPTNNPWAADTFNLTEQGKILTADPARANALATAAGVTI